jgi:hypothetical protein
VFPKRLDPFLQWRDIRVINVEPKSRLMKNVSIGVSQLELSSHTLTERGAATAKLSRDCQHDRSG